MPDWRDHILNHFHPAGDRLSLVADPDGLLADEQLLAGVRARGYEPLRFDDPIAFRFAYESRFRPAWDQNTDLRLVVIFPGSRSLLRKSLPHDVLQAGRLLDFSLSSLFPGLDYPIIASLDPALLDKLHAALEHHDGSPLGPQASADFILDRCYDILPHRLRTPADLLRAILPLLRSRVILPLPLRERILASLASQSALAGWPVGDLLGDREQALRFLQSEWQHFLHGDSGNAPARIPFAEVKEEIAILFLEGVLQPLQVADPARFPAWARPGLLHDPLEHLLSRFAHLRQHFSETLPTVEAPYRDWLLAARTHADLVTLRWALHQHLNDEDRANWDADQEQIQARFGRWLLARYGSLHNLPHLPRPVMVHHIPRYLAAERKKHGLEKVALLVIDGLAWDQWLLVKAGLARRADAFQFEEDGVFAWIPTLTSVSRQALFAGELPFHFPDSIDTTAKEPTLWAKFWDDQGVPRDRVALVKNVRDVHDAELERALTTSSLAVLGLVINTVDDISHGMKLGTAGQHDQIRLWESLGLLREVLLRLLDEGFGVYLTADHGNISALGCGTPSEGLLAETRGQRARVYSDPAFRAEVKAVYPDSIEWPDYGLPPGYHVLVPGGLSAFATKGEQVVAHGGISLEEVVVPFVSVRRAGA